MGFIHTDYDVEIFQTDWLSFFSRVFPSFGSLHWFLKKAHSAHAQWNQFDSSKYCTDVILHGSDWINRNAERSH